MSMLENWNSRGGGACPKTGRPLAPGGRYRWVRWVLPIAGLVSLVWFLVRVIPKPSRATYPCQRLAFPLASSFVAWVLGLGVSWAAFHRARRHFAMTRLAAGIGCLCAGVAAVWLLIAGGQGPAVGDVPTPNAPLGVARGVQPGRVVWVHDPNATDWAGYSSPEHWYDDAHTDPVVVSRMMSQAVRRLAGQSTDATPGTPCFGTSTARAASATSGTSAVRRSP